MRRYKPVSQRYADALSQVSWQDFERLLADWYAGQGYRVEHVGTAGSGFATDGGIDLKLLRGDEYLVVQCKHWRTCQVTHNAVHELLGVMLTERATGAVVVTSGEFTHAARAAATREQRVQLIDGAALRRMLGTDSVGLALHSDDASAAAPAAAPAAPPIPAWHGVASPARRGRRTRRSRNPLPGMVVAILAGLVALYFIRHVLAEFGARRPTPRAAALHRVSSTPARMPALAVRPRAPAPPKAGSLSHPAVVYEQTPMTEAELRDWKRRNAEAMKILKQTTPEVP